MCASAITLDRPWLTFDLGARMRVHSWALNRPGFVTASRIIWREVRNAALPEGFDVRAWYLAELAERGDGDSVAFLTSRDIRHYHTAEAYVAPASAVAVATVGLSNAERVGHRRAVPTTEHGTINVAVKLSTGLTDAGLIEALSIAVEARTAAVMDAQVALPTGAATGTGTDCIAIAAAEGGTDYAGLHTEGGEALGRAVYDAVHAGAVEWKAEQEMTINA